MDLLNILLLNKMKHSGVKPTGSIDITENGTVDVTNYAIANVNVPSSGAIAEKDVNFYDYDGTLVYSYTKADFLQLSEMPENPSHTGLVAQGWNWTLLQIQTYLTYYDKVDVAQIYTTASGKCEFDITLNKVTGLTITLNMTGKKNWGDNTTDSLTTHTYSDYGSYTITCDGTEINSGLIFGQASNKRNGYVTAVRIAGVASIYEYAFDYCTNIETVILSKDVTTLGNYLFRENKFLKYIGIPNTVTSIPQYFCNNNTLLGGISIPPSVTTINQYAFGSCTKLKRVTLPLETVTLQSGYTFYNCYALEEITLSPSLGYFTNYCFAMGAFKKLDLSKFTQVPTFGTSALSNFSKQAPIIVPDNLYDTFVSYAGWSNYANYLVKASEYEG